MKSGHIPRMVALDELRQANLQRLERLIEEVREVLRRPGSGDEKVALLREVLAVAGYRV